MIKIKMELLNLNNSPLMVTPLSLESFSSFIEQLNGMEANSKNSSTNYSPNFSFNAQDKIGAVQIEGAILSKPTAVSKFLNVPDYRTIINDFKTLISVGSKIVVLEIDSNGGAASQAFETASLLRQLADKNKVKLVSYAGRSCNSAAFALACTSHELIVNDDSELGGVGVVATLRNDSKRLQSAGIKDTYVYAGAEKVPFNNNGDWKQSFINDVQSKVDSVYDRFVKHVSDYRKIPQSKVIATQGKTYSSKDAIAIGFADKAMACSDFKDYVGYTKPTTSKSAKTTSKSKPITTTKAKAESPDIPAGYILNSVTGMLQARTPITLTLQR